MGEQRAAEAGSEQFRARREPFAKAHPPERAQQQQHPCPGARLLEGRRGNGSERLIVGIDRIVRKRRGRGHFGFPGDLRRGLGMCGASHFSPGLDRCNRSIRSGGWRCRPDGGCRLGLDRSFGLHPERAGQGRYGSRRRSQFGGRRDQREPGKPFARADGAGRA
jgi:hypothetical protein